MSDDDNPNQLIQFAATTAKVARVGRGWGNNVSGQGLSGLSERVFACLSCHDRKCNNVFCFHFYKTFSSLRRDGEEE